MQKIVFKLILLFNYNYSDLKASIKFKPNLVRKSCILVIIFSKRVNLSSILWSTPKFTKRFKQESSCAEAGWCLRFQKKMKDWKSYFLSWEHTKVHILGKKTLTMVRAAALTMSFKACFSKNQSFISCQFWRTLTSLFLAWFSNKYSKWENQGRPCQLAFGKSATIQVTSECSYLKFE